MAKAGGAKSGEAASSGLGLHEEAALAVWEAAARGDEAALLAWLDSGGRVNATCGAGDVGGSTALMLAAHNGQERVVELLLQHGAEVNLQVTAMATPR